MAKKLTSKKAREILHDKSVHGHPLTDKQRKFFGAIAGGAPVKQKTGGWMNKYEYGGEAGYTDIPFKYNSAWGGQFQDGGKLTDEQLDSLNKAKMKAKMALAAEFGNPSAKRMVSHVPPTYKFIGNETIDGENVVGFGENQVRLPGTGTHFMSSMGEFAVPYIQQDASGNMIFNANASPRDREAIRFDNPEDAQYFAEHYKDVAPMMQNFAMGGSIGGTFPGSVGFTYARTQGIPSEGPYAKKTMPSAQDGMDIKNRVIETLSNLPIYSPDERYSEYQGNIQDWKKNLENVKVEDNPNLQDIVRYNTPGSYIDRDVLSPVKTYPYQGTVQVNPKYYNPIDTKERVISHELTHGAFEGDKTIPQWLGDNLYHTARNPEGFEKGAHWDMLSERAPELMGVRRDIIDAYGLPLDAKIPREAFDSYLRGQMETELRTGKSTESNELKESLFGARNATDLYNLINMENIPQRTVKFDVPGLKNGGMTFYQHGLDWKPKTISKNGSAISKAQDGIKKCGPGQVNVNGNCVSIYSPEYKKAYEEGLTGFGTADAPSYITSERVKTLPEVTVTAKMTPEQKQRIEQEKEERLEKQQQRIKGTISRMVAQAKEKQKEAQFWKDFEEQQKKAFQSNLRVTDAPMGNDPATVTKHNIKDQKLAQEKAEKEQKAYDLSRIAQISSASPDTPESEQRRKALNSQIAASDPDKYRLNDDGDLVIKSMVDKDTWNDAYSIQTPELVETASMLTPSGNKEAGEEGAKFFVNTNPYLAPLTAIGRVTQTATGQNPYGFDVDDIVSAKNILPTIGALADITGLYHGYGAVPGLKQVGQDIKAGITPSATSEASNIKGSFGDDPLFRKAIDRYIRRKSLPESTDTNVKSVFDDFRKRITTPEGKRRLRELGISSDEYLQTLKVIEDEQSWGYHNPEGNGVVGVIAMHPDAEGQLARNVARHEIEHAVQEALRRSLIDKANSSKTFLQTIFNPSARRKLLEQAHNTQTTEIDNILSDLELRKEGTNPDWEAIRQNSPQFKERVEWKDLNLGKPEDLQKAVDYFLTGSKGAEKSTFLGEVQQYMLDKGYIKDPYETITPEKVKEVFAEGRFDKESPLRLFHIMKATDKNYDIISKALNKMLTIVPAVGVGAGALMQGEDEQPQQQKKGGIIKDDRGQWAHPGKITEIGSNQITMKGVPYPVLGISDQGDTQMMFPEQEYKFKGKKVVEYPITQKVNQKSTGGWLSQYK